MPDRRPVGDVIDPAFRRERASKAGKAAQSLDAYVRHVVDRAGELTPEHLDQLRALLAPAKAGADAA